MSVGIHSSFSGTRSFPVMTASTPFTASALLVSMPLMWACAYGLRTMSRWSMPGSFTSSTYLPRPRMKRASSLRLTLWPMPPSSTAIPLRPFPLLLRGVLDGLHDVHVAGAAAEVPGDGLADPRLARILLLLEERDRGHHHPGGAEPALEAVLLVEALLHGMELAVLLETLDRADGAPVGLNGEDGARLHRLPVEY